MHSTTLYNASHGYEVLRKLWDYAKPRLLAGHRLTLMIGEEKRNLDQNAKFHALCEDLAKSRIEWAGKPRNAADWKVLLVSGHAVATKQGHELIPGLEGEFVNLRESTARMSKERASSLIEYAMAFCAQHAVNIRE